MRVKHFFIRLTKEHMQTDEDRLNEFMQTVAVKKTATQFVTAGQTNYWSILVFHDDISTLEASDSKTDRVAFDISTLTDEEKVRYEALRTWRGDLARQQALPSYIIASNAELAAIAKLNPSTIEELYKVKGMGDKKISKHGEEIIALMNSI
jgi:superfamily II DNA helicase RecQ